MPLTALPEPDRSLLPDSPLDLVVCQIRFEHKPEISQALRALSFHEAIGGADGDYAKLDELSGQSVNVDLGGGAPSVTRDEAPGGWQFASADGAWIVSLVPEHVALECKGDYPGWEEFSQRLHALLDALVAQIGPAVERRIGLRYIDLITEMDARRPEDWVDFLAPEIVGLAGHSALGEHVANARHQVLFDLGAGHGCVLNHGFVPQEGGNLGYLLDYDVFRDGGRAFDPAAVRETLTALHDDALKLFQATTTDALRERFRG